MVSMTLFSPAFSWLITIIFLALKYGVPEGSSLYFSFHDLFPGNIMPLHHSPNKAYICVSSPDLPPLHPAGWMTLRLSISRAEVIFLTRCPFFLNYFFLSIVLLCFQSLNILPSVTS